MSEYELSALPVEYYLDKVRELDKVPADDPRVQHFLATGERPETHPVSNNFFQLWGCLRDDLPEGDPYWIINKELYLSRAEAYPQWDQFIKDNASAIESANEMVRTVLEPHKAILREANMRANKGDTELLYALDIPEHPCGSFTAAELYLKDEMDRLFGDLAIRMQHAGMDPRPFYG